MNTQQMMELLECKIRDNVDFFGVLSQDQFCESTFNIDKHEICVIIMNSEPLHSNMTGHWLCFISTGLLQGSSPCLLFFDSLGKSVYNYIPRKIIRRIDLPIKCVIKELQGESPVCGYYCLTFVSWLLNNNFNSNAYLNLFSTNRNKNDIVVSRLFAKMFNQCM